jgi:hypothetical protein
MPSVVGSCARNMDAVGVRNAKAATSMSKRRSVFISVFYSCGE